MFDLFVRGEELTDGYYSVCVVTSSSCDIVICMQWWWGRGLEAPVDDNWCISRCVGCCREHGGLWPRKLDPEWGSDLLSAAAVGTVGAQHPKSVHSTLLVADLLDLLSFTVKHYGCCLGLPSHTKEEVLLFSFSSVRLLSFFPSFPFLVFLKLAKMPQSHTLKSVSLFWQFIVMGWQEHTQLLEVWDDDIAGICYINSK